MAGLFFVENPSSVRHLSACRASVKGVVSVLWRLCYRKKSPACASSNAIFSLERGRMAGSHPNLFLTPRRMNFSPSKPSSLLYAAGWCSSPRVILPKVSVEGTAKFVTPGFALVGKPCSRQTSLDGKLRNLTTYSHSFFPAALSEVGIGHSYLVAGPICGARPPSSPGSRTRRPGAFQQNVQDVMNLHGAHQFLI